MLAAGAGPDHDVGMGMRLHNITFDCSDAPALAGFWAALVGWNVFTDEDPEVLVVPHYPFEGTGLLFIPVPEGKSVKNRVHLDLEPEDRTRDAAVERAVELGARVLADFRNPDGTGWVTLADPEGNEFCIERSAAERETGAPRTFRLG